jgi:hypothetical protein
MGMAIDPKVKEPARKMLGQAIGRELDTLAVTIRAVGNKKFLTVLDLVTFTAGYIAIDVAGMRWPTDAMVRQIARDAGESAAQLPVTGEMIYEFLSRDALGPQMPGDMPADEVAGVTPLFATASLLLTFCPPGRKWSQYLDQIWDAAEVAGHVQDWVVPALVLRVGKNAMRAESATPAVALSPRLTGLSRPSGGSPQPGRRR